MRERIKGKTLIARDEGDDASGVIATYPVTFVGCQYELRPDRGVERMRGDMQQEDWL